MDFCSTLWASWVVEQELMGDRAFHLLHRATAILHGSFLYAFRLQFRIYGDQ